MSDAVTLDDDALQAETDDCEFCCTHLLETCHREKIAADLKHAHDELVEAFPRLRQTGVILSRYVVLRLVV